MVPLLDSKWPAAAAASKSLQSCPTLCDPIDGSPPGSVPEILQARILEWVATSFSKQMAYKICISWKIKELISCLCGVLFIISKGSLMNDWTHRELPITLFISPRRSSLTAWHFSIESGKDRGSLTPFSGLLLAMSEIKIYLLSWPAPFILL